MTIAEAKVAVRLNSNIYFERKYGGGLKGYVISIAWVHNKGEKPYITVGCHDHLANSVFYALPEDLEVTDWKKDQFTVDRMIEAEEKKNYSIE